MSAFTAKATGNWSSGGQTTWNEVGVPGNGDTASIGGVTITVDVDTTIGNSPNNNTTAVVDKTSATGALIVGAGVTFTVKGNIGGVHASTFTQEAGSTVTFDNSGSGGSPVYTFVNGGFQKFNFNGTSGSPCVIQAISGQTWATYGAWDASVATYTTFRRAGNATISAIGGETISITHCTWDTSGSWSWESTATNVSLIFNDNTFTGSTDATDSVAIQYTGALVSGTRTFLRNVLDKNITYNSKDFAIVGNYIGGNWSALTGVTWTSWKHNFVIGDGSANSGNGALFPGSISRSYFVIEDTGGNPHFISPTALLGADNVVSQVVFESQSPDLDDTGDCIIVKDTCCSGGNKIVGSNNIAVRGSAGVMSGCIATLYNAHSSTLTEFYRNTANIDDAIGGKRGMFSFAEANTGTAGQIAALKSNLAHGSSASQGYKADRITGNVKDIITAAAADRNWIYNGSAGDNQRGYEDVAASNTIWTAGDAVAAGVDANGGTADPSFVDATRNAASWCSARGYGAATYAAAKTALKADVSRIQDLIDYIFEGHKVQNASMRNAAHDGGCVGAANYHKSTRTLAAVTALRTTVNARYAGVSV